MRALCPVEVEGRGRFLRAASGLCDRPDQLPEVAGRVLREDVTVTVERDRVAAMAGALEPGDGVVECVTEADRGVGARGRLVLGVDGEVDLGAVVGVEPAERPELRRLGTRVRTPVADHRDQPLGLGLGLGLMHTEVDVVEGRHPASVCRVGNLPPVADASIPVTGDPEADRLLVEDPLALLIGMLLDQQVPMEWAFKAPHTLKERLGGLDAAKIAAMPEDDVVAAFTAKPALHRFPGSMGKRAHALCQAIVDDYGGGAEAVWRDAASGDELFTRLKALPGFGDDKSKIFLSLLAKRFGVKPPGWEEAGAPFSDATPRSVADIDSPETLAQVRNWKRSQKAKGKTKKD